MLTLPKSVSTVVLAVKFGRNFNRLFIISSLHPLADSLTNKRDARGEEPGPGGVTILTTSLNRTKVIKGTAAEKGGLFDTTTTADRHMV